MNQDSNLIVYPDEPIGDVSTAADLFASIEDGDIEFTDTDEQGAPKKKKIKAKALVNKIATKQASPAEKRAFKSVVAKNPSAGRAMEFAAAARAASRNDSVRFEHAVGAKLISSNIGPGACLRHTEIVAAQTQIIKTTPFEPQEFPFTGSPATLDLQQSIFAAAGASTVQYVGIYVKLSASLLNVAQGASITIARKLGLINAVQTTMTSNWQLEQGVRAAEFLLLNAVLISGKARAYFPQLTGAAGADATTNIVITNLPTNYTASARFLQPGDGIVEKFLSLL